MTAIARNRRDVAVLLAMGVVLASCAETPHSAPAGVLAAKPVASIAADPGDATAQAQLGLKYERGEGVPQNYAEALVWYRKAAAQGDALAEYHLATFFEQGRSVVKDMAAAAIWYRKAAEQGLMEAEASLGRLDTIGASGVPVDYAQAMIWYRKAADQGSAIGENGVGHLYLYGYGVAKDEGQAAHWLGLAAAQNLADAETSLGFLLLRGIGVPKNAAEGARLLTKAALQGSYRAQYTLGYLAENGEGEPKNLGEAYLWYDLAAASGNAQAVLRRNAVGRLLSPAEIEKAQARAAEAKPAAAASQPQTVASLAVPPLTRMGLGSGVIVGRAGEILTARHVVDGCREVRVADGATAAQVIEHPTTDLALLRFAPGSIGRQASLRDWSGLRQGEAVSVVGFPFGGALALGTTVTAGNLSSLVGPAGDRTFIQISAAAQPGNSGGPVLDLAGNVVGVLTNALDVSKLVALNGRAAQNINFAVSGAVARGFLEAQGVAIDTRPLARALDPADVAAMAQHFTVKLECWK